MTSWTSISLMWARKPEKHETISAPGTSSLSVPKKGLSIIPSTPTIAISNGQALVHWIDMKDATIPLRVILAESPSSPKPSPTLSTSCEVLPPSPPISISRKQLLEDRFEEALAYERQYKTRRARVPLDTLTTKPVQIPHHAIPFFGFDDDEANTYGCSEGGSIDSRQKESAVRVSVGQEDAPISAHKTPRSSKAGRRHSNNKGGVRRGRGSNFMIRK